MKHITDEYIDDIHKTMWKAMIKKHGTAYRVPRDDQYIIGEIVRGLYVAQIWQKHGANGNPMSALQQASVNPTIAETIITEHLGGRVVKKDEKSATLAATGGGNKAKMQNLITNAMKNYGKQFTTEQLAEISGFSTQTVVKHLKSLKYYRKIKRGLYEARDPKKPE